VARLDPPARRGAHGVMEREARRSRRPEVLYLGILFISVAWIGGCQAPQGGRRDGVKTLDITSIRRQLEFTVRARDQEQTSKVGAGDSSMEEREFEEAVRIKTEGSVYHPNFLEFSLAGLFGLLQSDFESQNGDRRQSSSDDGDVLEFDFEGHFLKKKRYPGTVFARQYRTLEPRPFLSSLETTTENYGFNWQYVDAKTPTSLQFNHTDVKLHPLDDTEDDGEQKNTSLRFESSYRFSEKNVLSLLYEHRATSEQPYDLDLDSDELTLTHRFDFGEQHEHRLDSEFNYFNQSGTYDIERTRWRETLRLSHTETVRSWYQTEILDRTQGSLSGVPPIQETSYAASGTLEHRLYESLVSQLYGFGQLQDFDDGLEITRYGVQPSFDYRKKNPWGVFLANYTFRAQTEEREGSGRSLEVVDERATFNDPEPVVLMNTNVVMSSIRMTAEDRLTVYRSGEDYRVGIVGDRVEIDRVPTGRILDGQTVLVDYIWLLAGDYTLDTLTHNVALRQNFKFGISPYYRLRDQDQDVTPASATGVQPEDITANIYGMEYQKGPLRLIAEYEDHESTITPFDALRLNADLTHRFRRDGTGRLRGRWTDIERKDQQNRKTEFFTIEGRYRQRIGEHLTLEGAVLYRTEEDSLSGNDEGVDVDLTLEWIIRETELRVTYEYGRFEDDFAENNNQTLFVQMKRRF